MEKIRSINIQSWTFYANQEYHLQTQFWQLMLSLHNFQIDDGQLNFVNIQQDSGSIHQLSSYGTHMYNHVHTHTHTGQTSRTYWTIPANKCIWTYMSMTSLTRTLTATSMDGFRLLLLNLDDSVIRFVEDVSEQTAAITSHTSAGFNRKGCCSLINNKTFDKREGRTTKGNNL